jgi:uncharacterized protein YuzE
MALEGPLSRSQRTPRRGAGVRFEQANMIVATYDAKTDVLFIELVVGAEGARVAGEEVYPGVVLMFDAARLIGIEITTASKVLPPDALASLLSLK